MPLAQQLVQVGHACLEAGAQFQQPTEPSYLVVLGVADAVALREALAQTEAHGVRWVTFYEPDCDYGLTAACSEPLPLSHRRIFRAFQLWPAHSRDPPLADRAMD